MTADENGVIYNNRWKVQRSSASANPRAPSSPIFCGDNRPLSVPWLSQAPLLTPVVINLPGHKPPVTKPDVSTCSRYLQTSPPAAGAQAPWRERRRPGRVPSRFFLRRPLCSCPRRCRSPGAKGCMETVQTRGQQVQMTTPCSPLSAVTPPSYVRQQRGSGVGLRCHHWQHPYY